MPVKPNDNPAVSWETPLVSDNSGIISSIASTASPGDSFSIGETSVNYSVVDGYGNRNYCVFRVVVKGN